MKKVKILISTLALGTVLFFASCTKDECKDVTCDNGGVCTAGVCDCETGFEGTNCETEERAKFLGNYSLTVGTITCDVSGNSSLSAGTSIVVSNNSTGTQKIAISVGGALTLIATVNGTTMTVDNQTIGGYTYTGSGSVNSNTITINLNEYDPSVPENCVYAITATK